MGNNPYSIAAVRTAFATLIMWAQTLDISFYQWRSWKSCSYEGKHVRRIKSCSTAQIAEIDKETLVRLHKNANDILDVTSVCYYSSRFFCIGDA